MHSSKKKKRKPWRKKRHEVITALAKLVLYPYIKIKYGAKMDKFRDQGKRQYLILANHQTGFDQFFVAYAFRGALYYVASEDIFSMGFISDLLRFAVNPIPIKKQTTDVGAVLNCLRVAKEGGSVVVFPEGNRTYSGKTEYMSPAIITLAKKLDLPIALMRIEGGYGVSPRWSDSPRKGGLHSYVSRVLEPEEYRSLSDKEFGDLIAKELYVNEANADKEYHSSCLAEYVERAIYYCPKCNALSTFESHGDTFACKKCGMTVKYLPTKELECDNFELPYRFVNDWYEAQKSFVNSLDLDDFGDSPIYEETANLFEVIVYKNKNKLHENMTLRFYRDRMTLEGDGKSYIFPLDETRAFTVLGKNKLNIYFGDKLYQIEGGPRFNSLKYVNLFFRYKNIKKIEKGEDYDEFLGL